MNRFGHLLALIRRQRFSYAKLSLPDPNSPELLSQAICYPGLKLPVKIFAVLLCLLDLLVTFKLFKLLSQFPLDCREILIDYIPIGALTHVVAFRCCRLPNRRQARRSQLDF
jgi:hypothetical protein